MSYEVTLLVFGILLLLVGLVGKVKAKEIEVGTSSRIVRIVLALLGIVLVVLSFNPDITKTFLSTPPKQTGEDIQGGHQELEKEAEKARLAEEQSRIPYTISPSETTLFPSDRLPLNLTPKGTVVHWWSSDSAVAMVDRIGVVTALKAGEAAVGVDNEYATIVIRPVPVGVVLEEILVINDGPGGRVEWDFNIFINGNQVISINPAKYDEGENRGVYRDRTWPPGTTDVSGSLVSIEIRGRMPEKEGGLAGRDSVLTRQLLEKGSVVRTFEATDNSGVYSAKQRARMRFRVRLTHRQ